ncbi:respiratory nitrate reductase subunit gamma [Pseudopelagicola sp. nBUS_19]|uniref:respiratory nitrate reductase subunit gamma n=1 Tax=unclassified Pseudopelagicola TaxID=2649563 RepID=UPI003EBC8DA3
MHQFIFGTLPYIAITIMVVGSIARYERDPYTWKTSSSQLLRRKQLVWGSILFHVGVLIIFLGHFFGLLLPVELYDALGVGHGFKQGLAAIGGGIAGVMALIGGSMLAHRRFADPRVRATSNRSDNAIILVLIAQLVLGLATVIVSLGHMDGHAMVNLMNWANGIFTFDPAAASYIADAHFFFKLHILLGLIIFILFPFTRLVHMLSAPLRYLWRPGYQIVRSRKGKV